ncbi:MAG: Smr/MutS family protein [Alphaproteobacteria bacterium]|nr:Smr/MutS family protein [Alphaproteobacteria bacterium]MCB9693841.1 Smr/MutS family protein [Alphaproteobacteria bacterium]
MDLSRHTEASLDTGLLRAAWVESASTTLAAQRLATLGPLPDAAAVRTAYAALREWTLLEEEQRAPSLSGAVDIGRIASGARKGEILAPQDLIAVGRTLDVLDRAARRLLDDDTIPELAGIAASIRFDIELLDVLSVAFEADGQLSARTYPELGELRRRINELHGTLRSTLESMAKGADLADDLQDAFWTVRNDRYVLPLKPHAKNRGVVHGTSGSGKTVFVEPHEILELNNRLRLAEGALEAEERRILAALSRQVGADAERLAESLEALVQLDIVASRSRLASRMRATVVTVSDRATVKLDQARHPILVLRGIEVIGHDLALDAARPALVLTGPNTGGKTIALKTLGLCAWMVRHGLALPCVEGSRFDFFDGVLADVGDAQTVEDDLSSFSAQLVAVREMLDRAGPGWLVLLDELASGTDPQQGAALAIAVLEALVDADVRVVTTTHYPPLKGLAVSDPRFRVAAMEVRAGRPTYRLIPDTTGESHALATAERLGLGAGLLERARELWKSQDQGVAETLEALELQRTRLADREAELDARLAAAEAREAELTRRTAQIRAKADALEAEAAEAFRSRLRSAEKAIGAVVAQLQESPSQKAARAARASLEAFAGLLPEPEVEVLPEPERAFEVGDQVRHPTLGTGIVEAVGKTLKVRKGMVAFTAKPGELELVGAPRATPKPAVRRVPVRVTAGPELDQALRMPHNTVDLRGMRVDEALDAVDVGLDKAVQAGTDVVFVLHGHGTGALKQAVREALRTHTTVDRFMPANADQGGDAYTVVAVRR